MSTGATTISRRDTIVGGVSELADGPASAGGKAGWPLSVHLRLGALPTAAPCARRYALSSWTNGAWPPWPIRPS